MKRLFYILAIALIATIAANAKLSQQAVISLVTYDPSESAVFTVFGHTAIRVNDPVLGIDYVYNYGIFDFESPNFIFRFTKGETDYMLGVYDYSHLIMECKYRSCGARELILNLNDDEKNKIFEALALNARPENARYRYNFFFDNCATRPMAIIEQNVSGAIIYPNQKEEKTFRQLINYCMRNNKWLIFGTELALGSPTDRVTTAREELFLPLYLEAAFKDAVILNTDGSERRLVLKSNVLLESVPEEVVQTWFTPMRCSLLLLGFVLLIMFFEWRKKTFYRSLDCVLFFIFGMAGCLIFFLAFVSVHPSTWPNWLILWLHPLHLLGVLFFIFRRMRRTAFFYSCLNLALLTGLLIGWNFIPQTFNISFLPLIAILWLRSASYIRFYFSHLSPK